MIFLNVFNSLIIFLLIYYLSSRVFCSSVDINSIPSNYNVSSSAFKSVPAKSNYSISWTRFASNNDSDKDRVQLLVSLPPQLRVMQQRGEDIGITIDVVQGNATITLTNVARVHNGPYSAYKVINKQLKSEIVARKDFHINVIGIYFHNTLFM